MGPITEESLLFERLRRQEISLKEYLEISTKPGMSSYIAERIKDHRKKRDEMKRINKYGSKKIYFGDMVFDSKLEFHRWCFLEEAEERGQICNLRIQVKYQIIPEAYGTREKHQKTKVKTETYVIEKACYYVADFVYAVPVDRTQSWKECIDKDAPYEIVIEDTKSEATRKKESYVIKRKLMRQLGTPIREVLRSTEDI